MEMADIIKCSGGEVMTTLPHPPGVGVIIVASPDDLSMLSAAAEGGMTVHSTELILGGVLRQDIDRTTYPLILLSLFIGCPISIFLSLFIRCSISIYFSLFIICPISKFLSLLHFYTLFLDF